MAGEILLRLKEQPEYGDIELVVVLPFENHDAEWDARSKSRLKFLINYSADTVTVGTTAEPAAVCYKRRNYYMVDHADCLLAVYDNDRSIRSGTGMTVNYAKKKDLPITLIHQDTGIVSVFRWTSFLNRIFVEYCSLVGRKSSIKGCFLPANRI